MGCGPLPWLSPLLVDDVLARLVEVHLAHLVKVGVRVGVRVRVRIWVGLGFVSRTSVSSYVKPRMRQTWLGLGLGVRIQG